METVNYNIVRFHRDKPAEIIKRGVSLAEAQEHCDREDTRGPDWFDGFRREGTTAGLGRTL